MPPFLSFNLKSFDCSQVTTAIYVVKKGFGLSYSHVYNSLVLKEKTHLRYILFREFHYPNLSPTFLLINYNYSSQT